MQLLKVGVASAFSRALVVLSVVAAFAVCLAAKDFVKPVAQPAKTYPAHDDHADEKVAIAADPYDTAEKAKIFSIKFREHGLLPMFFVATNDGGQPISIARMQVTLTTANGSKLTPISTEDMYRRLSNPRTNTNAPLPFPIPQAKVKGQSNRRSRTRSNRRDLPPRLSSLTPRNQDSSSLMCKTSTRRLPGRIST
jgi:hypothetical protein